jgi:hypothetical protein
MLLVFMVGLGFSNSIIPTSGPLSSIWAYVPTLESWISGFSYILLGMLGWITIVFFNHFGDVMAVFATHGLGDFSTWLGTVSAFIHVAVFQTIEQFITVLWNDPRNLMNTLLITEVSTFAAYILAGTIMFCDYIVGYTHSCLLSWWGLISTLTHGSLDWLVNQLGTGYHAAVTALAAWIFPAVQAVTPRWID